MASNSRTSSMGAGQAAPDALVVNLQVISPSVGVTAPLQFPVLSASLTVKELKAKIRDTLPMRPADENQRLIYRGRAIVQETDSLLDVFGHDTLKDADQQTIHLVLRNPTEAQPTSGPVQPMANATPGPRGQPGPQLPTHNLPMRSSSGLPPPPAFGFPQGNPWDSHPPPPPANTQEHTQHPQHQAMSNWLRDVANRSGQQTRAMHDARGRLPGGGDPTRGQEINAARASSAPGHTIYRETVGPHGRTFQVQTVQTVVHRTAPHRRGEVVLGTPQDEQPGQADLHRSASSASLHNRMLGRPGVTTPIVSPGLHRRPTPDQGPRTASGMSNMSSAFFPPQATPPQPIEVYILSSPDGPRALLMNNQTSETYYTPRMQTLATQPHIRHPVVPHMGMISEVQPGPNTGGVHNPRNMYGAPLHPEPQPIVHDAQPTPAARPAPAAQPAQPPAPGPAPAGAEGVPPVALGHLGNPAVAALPQGLIQLWPHIWTMLRAGVFAWLFTNSDSAWVRWFTIIGIAFATLLLSTGALTDVVTRAWQPLGRQLEHLLPALEQGHRRPGGGGNADAAPNEAQNEAQPDPAQMAARLIADHQEREPWLTTQRRRVERAGLLFLASIAPGVAERHIANLEAEARAEREQAERAERERRDAEEEAANQAEQNEAGESGNRQTEYQEANRASVNESEQPQSAEPLGVTS